MKHKIISVVVEDVPSNHKCFKVLDLRWRLAQIPFIGRWLSGGYYN